MQEMNCGLDFGTSSCSVGIWANGSTELVPLEGDKTNILSAIYTAKPTFSSPEIDDDELARRTEAAKRKQDQKP